MSEERIKTKVQMGILKPAHQVFEAIVDPEKMNKYFPLFEKLLKGCGIDHPHQEAKLVAAQLDGIVIHYLLAKEGYPLDEVEKYLIEKYCTE